MESSQAFELWSIRIKASDEDAFEALFRALHGQLRGFATSVVHDVALAEDIVQEAFVRVWQNRINLDQTKSLRALLFTMVRNLALNHQRDSKTRMEKQTEFATRQPDRTISHPVESEDQIALINRCIAELPDRQREALSLTRFSGLSHAEVGEIMQVSPRTVNNHLVRALKYIRDRLRESEPSLLAH